MFHNVSFDTVLSMTIPLIINDTQATGVSGEHVINTGDVLEPFR